MNRTPVLTLVASLLVIVATPAQAQFDNVGSIDFPTSATGEAQEHFLRGVATLHSFGWKQAIRAELNAVYQALGDHFFDDGIATATLNLQGIESRDQDKFMSGTAAWLR